MAELSVTQWNNEDQTIEDVDWEEQSYREGCAYAREQAKRRLQTLDDELLDCKPKGLNVEGFRNRTVVTRFGEVVVRRRMYRDGDGNTMFALDDYLGWKPRQQASPSLTESIVSMASAVPFRMANKMVSDLTAGVLSPMTVHRLLSGVGQNAMDEEHNRWESCFEHGEDVCDGQQQADVLYTEADGVWVHLQREDRKHYEVKSGIAYRGWRSVGDDRYELVDKRVYAHASEEIPFWEGAGIEWGKQYALDGVKLFVVGGDGANWIRSGTEEFGNAIFQLDGFHLSRACGRGYGGEIGPAIYDAIRSGSESFAQSVDVGGCASRDHNGHPGQGVRRIQPVQRSGLAQPSTQRSTGRAEPGGHGIQRRQAHCEPNEEAGYELDYTRSASYVQSDPVESER